MKTVIYGNGAIAKLLFSYARHTMDIAGFTVDENYILPGAETYLGKPLVPFENVENFFPANSHCMINAVGFIEMNALREKKYVEARKKGYRFVSYIHDSVILHDDVTIGENCIILDHVSIHPGSKVGIGTFISSNVNVGHDCNFGDWNWVNSGVSIAGGCHIAEGCFFGVNSSVGHDVRMGARTFVGANTFISKNTKDDQVYLSEPGQLFRLKSRSFLQFSRMLD